MGATTRLGDNGWAGRTRSSVSGVFPPGSKERLASQSWPNCGDIASEPCHHAAMAPPTGTCGLRRIEGTSGAADASDGRGATGVADGGTVQAAVTHWPSNRHGSSLARCACHSYHSICPPANVPPSAVRAADPSSGGGRGHWQVHLPRAWSCCLRPSLAWSRRSPTVLSLSRVPDKARRHAVPCSKLLSGTTRQCPV